MMEKETDKCVNNCSNAMLVDDALLPYPTPLSSIQETRPPMLCNTKTLLKLILLALEENLVTTALMHA